MCDWIKVIDELPDYGDPVLIIDDGVAQHVTYMLDASEDGKFLWFEPYFFDCGDEVKITVSKITHWMPIPEPPKCEQ